MKEENAQSSQIDAKQLLAYKKEFQKQVDFGNSRKERIEKLMVRRSAGKWTPEKRERMMRRHMDAVSQAEQASKMVDQINLQIEKVR